MDKNLLILFLAVYSVFLTGQVRKISEREVYAAGNVELGLSTNIGVNDLTISGDNDLGFNFYPENTGREFYLNLNAYGGYFILEGLSLGPEIGINLTFENPTLYIIGNLAYTFNSVSRSAYPYIKVGYGVTDLLNYSDQETGLFESLNYSLLNLGLGIKFLQSDYLAFILEVNYKYITGSDTALYYYYNPYATTQNINADTKMSVLSISLGSSIVL